MDVTRLLGYVLRILARYLLAGVPIDQALRLAAERIDPTPGKGTPERVAMDDAYREREATEIAAGLVKPTDTPERGETPQPETLAPRLAV